MNLTKERYYRQTRRDRNYKDDSVSLIEEYLFGASATPLTVNVSDLLDFQDSINLSSAQYLTVSDAFNFSDSSLNIFCFLLSCSDQFSFSDSTEINLTPIGGGGGNLFFRKRNGIWL